ncbi:MAG: SbcD_Mre11, partial [uncultured Thermomicrobiales bacterium]
DRHARSRGAGQPGRDRRSGGARQSHGRRRWRRRGQRAGRGRSVHVQAGRAVRTSGSPGRSHYRRGARHRLPRRGQDQRARPRRRTSRCGRDRAQDDRDARPARLAGDRDEDRWRREVSRRAFQEIQWNGHGSLV